MANNAFGIDLGTNNIKIYSRSDDSILVEKNMIAIENKNTLFAYGDSAFEMYEKAPSNIHITYPLSSGVIADIKNMETLVRYFIFDLQKGNGKPADFYIAVPTDVTEVEKRAFYDLIKDSNVKARKIMVVEKAVADGLGMEIDVKNSQGVLVVNVGYETTEISILSLGGIVLSRLIKTGGLKFDEAIRAADLLLVRSGFSAMRASDNRAYSEEGPAISARAAELIVERYQNLKAVGMDWISLSSPLHLEDGIRAHQIMLGKTGAEPVLIIEDIDLSGLDPDTLETVFALPLFIEGIDSAPVTILAKIRD